MVASELRFWGDEREDVEDEFVWKFEDCEAGMRWINVRYEEVQELVLRLVWEAKTGMGDRPTVAACCFPTRLYASLENNVGEFSPPQLMTP